MKKVALTFALISTVIVATSFETPQTNSSSDNNQKFAMHADTDIGGDNVSTGRNQGRKLDFSSNIKIESKINLNQSEGFREDRQSQGKTIKLD